MYAEFSIIVAGALDEEATFTDETLVDEFLAGLEQEAEGSGYRFEVYRIDHDHELGIECECVQFLTDHKPYRVFNPQGNS